MIRVVLGKVNDANRLKISSANRKLYFSSTKGKIGHARSPEEFVAIIAYLKGLSS